MSDDKDRELAELNPSPNSDPGEQPGEPTDAETTAASPAASPAAPPAAPPATEPRSASSAIAWLAILLVLLVAAGVLWSRNDAQRREVDLLQRVRALESVSGQDDSVYTQMRDNLQRQIELEIEGIRDRQQRVQEDIASARQIQQQTQADIARAQQAQQRLQDEQQRAISRLDSLAGKASSDASVELRAEIAALAQSVREQGRRIADLSVDDRESWLLAEVHYLLRLANQRLIMTGDTDSAEALLGSADTILRELENADLYLLRSAVSSDLAAVRAVPRLDIQGLYLRLDALIRQTDSLVMFQMPQRSREVAPVSGDNWRGRLKQGYASALQKLSDYIVVSRRDVPIEALMDPQYEGLVRQNMRMLLEQAQVAMLSGNETLFRQSLERAQGWVSQFFKSDEQAAVAMAGELRVIVGEQITVELPDVTASLRALDAVMQARLVRDGN